MTVIPASSPEGEEILHQMEMENLRWREEWRSPEGRTLDEELAHVQGLIDELEEAHAGEFDELIDGLQRSYDSLMVTNP